MMARLFLFPEVKEVYDRTRRAVGELKYDEMSPVCPPAQQGVVTGGWLGCRAINTEAIETTLRRSMLSCGLIEATRRVDYFLSVASFPLFVEPSRSVAIS